MDTLPKKKRIELGLEKSHINDAFLIACGKNQERTQPYVVKQNRRNNRSIQTNRKGYGRSIRRKRYDFQPTDLVEKNQLIHKVKGVFNYGRWVRLVNQWREKVNSSIKKVSLVKYGAGLQFIPT
ncbi:MAG: hypothetical protein BTN85_1887 [Candidatus Methanohalarchaeum thermophilum]|uniref:Uncharacterized protein n=1 Tax=Methanohalarchaeum thermophilum TaxID=1903181 RepID=A0A1Q6DS94_METT1|nr:MAG: hypothetical protein BTN85_1887 [Candidatus Methanohalarchaeum thermophilum]